VKTADCAAPMKFAHVANDNCAGYLFNVNACKVLHDLISVCLLGKIAFFIPYYACEKYFIVVIARLLSFSCGWYQSFDILVMHE